jgi:hypothetical protein
MPRKALATLLLLVSVATAYGIQADSEWFRFTSPKGLFSLLLPHEPKLDANDSTTETLTHQRFNDFEEGYGFVIEYFGTASVGDPEKYLEGTSEGIRKVVQGTLVEEKKISLDGYPGHDLTLSFTTADGTVLFSRTRIYIVDSSLFSISYVWRKDIDPAVASKIGEKYFSSLKIKPRE